MLDAATGRLLGEVPASGLGIHGVISRNDIRTLVTSDIAITPTSAIQLWRIPTSQPWLVIIGLPLLVALIPSAVARWRK